MCRLFGFRSVIDSHVHRSLLLADNALGVQSRVHPDGWGVAYYLGGAPHVVKSSEQAMSDALFRQVSGVVSSKTVLAHIRRATQGDVSIVNCHPFQYGRWVFAHNGNLGGFRKDPEALAERIPRGLRRFVLGRTDSEAFFHLLIGFLARRGDVHCPEYPIDEAAAAVREAVSVVTELYGPLESEPGKDMERSWLTFILTNGELMLAHQGGQDLFCSTHKSHCPERDTCTSFAFECENESRSGYVNHFMVASENLGGDNVWQPVEHRHVIGVDRRLRLKRY